MKSCGVVRVMGQLIVALVMLVAPSVSRAADRPCTFNIEGGSQVNALFPDESATYWPSNAPIPDGGYVEIHGQFPHARYMSWTTYTPQLQSVDGLNDTQILPDPGSTNPYLVGADRTAVKRDYTVRIVKGQVPAGGRAPNTIYTTSADGSKSGGTAQRFSLRIYDPDMGTDREGGVPLPQVTIVTSSGTRIPVPSCPDQAPPDTGLTSILANSGTGAQLPAGTNVRATNPPAWHKFTSLGSALTGDSSLGGPEGGFGDNPDNKYVFTFFSQDFGQVLLLRAKAPSFPHTDAGEPVMGSGQVRYWSFCTNSQATNFYACRQDEQVQTDQAGNFAVVVSTAAARPRNATGACGFTWLPSGPLNTSVLILRNMLPDPTFREAIQNTQPGTEAKVMGPYYPDGKYYATTADFERLGCPAKEGNS